MHFTDEKILAGSLKCVRKRKSENKTRKSESVEVALLVTVKIFKPSFFHCHHTCLFRGIFNANTSTHTSHKGRLNFKG